ATARPISAFWCTATARSLAISPSDLTSNRLSQRAGFGAIGALCSLLTALPFEGTMKKLWIGAVAATLSMISLPASAFEVQGATVVLPDATSQFGEAGLNSRPGG